ncbi:MAG: S9 family peptidase [bacterium]|nr:S9 family peptidase [bacterium]
MQTTYKVVAMMILASVAAGCGGGAEPPVAKQVAHEMTIHGDTRTDDYYWLREREDPEVIAYLEAENAYTEAALDHVSGLRTELFEEMKGRIKEDESSAPYELRGYWYYDRYRPGGEYEVVCRRRGSMDGPEEIMLDGDALSEGHDYFAMRGAEVSPDNRLLIYGTDTVGRRFYTLRVKNLETGELLPDVIPDVTGNVEWAMDNRTLFYSRQDPETLRTYQIWRHELGTDPADDVLVFTEEDDTFGCWVWRTKSDEYLVISSSQTLSTESRLLAADDPTGEFRVFQPRQRDLEYHIEHHGDRFLVHTNLHATNFRLMDCPEDKTWLAHWREVEPHRQDVLLEDVDVFTDFLVLTERRNGLSHLRVMDLRSGESHDLDFGEPTWSAWSAYNPQMDTRTLRYGYSSLTTPRSTYAYDMTTRERELVKQQEVLGGFDPADYQAEYLHATARDGTPVPISLVYRKGLARDGKAPLLLYAYGSYGYSRDADFRSTRLSLLDRGFVYAIAHVRGGQEMGRQWYEDGKLLKKMNTFTDFIDCGEHLVAEGYTSRDKLFAAGGSAGGLLVGVVVNEAPDLWRGAVAAVPFVDVITTMLDDTIPLTTGEYDEWGNPHDKTYYDYMLSYSPYDNVRAQDYPSLLVTAGLHDSQVQYWEPAKWVAKMRAEKTDDNRLLLRTNMDAGHGGQSGRYRSLEETALEFAFCLDLAGVR